MKQGMVKPMNKKTGFSALMFFSLTLGLLYLWHDTAEAARMGRSKSFGSKPSYQRSAPAPSQNTTSAQSKPDQAAQSQPATGTPRAPMGRFGGLLGGMLMGGLIGSLLFGGGFAGPGLLDMLLIGGGLFMLFRFLRARRMAAHAPSPGGAMSYESGSPQAWGSANYTPSEQALPAAAAQPPLPPGFDADEFLKGANILYRRLQAAWDKRDLEDIRQFTSDEVFTEIRQQAQEDPTPGKTELLLINEHIHEVSETDKQTIVSVLYDVMLRENEDQVSKQVRELWHFSMERDNSESFWLLEGIQQVDQ
jgi:predicted lipid-binding transport protein (Tim44 family)